MLIVGQGRLRKEPSKKRNDALQVTQGGKEWCIMGIQNFSNSLDLIRLKKSQLKLVIHYGWLKDDQGDWLKALAHYTRNRKQCSYLSYTLQFFFHNNKIFFNSFVCRKPFPQLFYKKLCSFVRSVRGPLSAVIYAIQTLGVGWYGNKNTSSKIYIRHGISMPAKHIHPLSQGEGESSKSIRKGFKKRI